MSRRVNNEEAFRRDIKEHLELLLSLLTTVNIKNNREAFLTLEYAYTSLIPRIADWIEESPKKHQLYATECAVNRLLAKTQEAASPFRDALAREEFDAARTFGEQFLQEAHKLTRELLQARSMGLSTDAESTALRLFDEMRSDLTAAREQIRILVHH